jgi:hypothetical protein
MCPLDSASRQQLSATVPLSPFGLLAVHVKIAVPGGCEITSVMSVTVSVGLTPVQLLFGQPATEPVTVGAAVKTAGFVVIERLPFLIALAGNEVDDEAGPT